MAGRRWLRLRWRLTAALAFVSALTLAVATLVLLLPLDRRLRKDAVATLEQDARAARQSFAELPPRTLRPGSPALTRTAVSLRRRTGSDVIVADAAGRPLVATSPEDLTERFPIAARAVAERAAVRGVDGDEDDAHAEAAVPVREDAPYALVVRRPLGAVTGTTGVVAGGLILAAIASMAIAIGTGALLARRLARRLDALRDTALRFPDGAAAPRCCPTTRRTRSAT